MVELDITYENWMDCNIMEAKTKAARVLLGTKRKKAIHAVVAR